MKNIFKNSGYFLKEVKTILSSSLLSNIFSSLSIGLIFFILAMLTSGLWISKEISAALKGEAEISVYYKEGIEASGGEAKIAEGIKEVDGVREVSLVSKDEAYSRMVEILGKDASALKYFEDNPFSAFIEVKIDIEKIDTVLNDITIIKDVEYIRDNVEILKRIGAISKAIELFGFIFLITVGFSTLVIVSHIIKQGIFINREQINTLRLLGAPEAFIATPFLLSGVVITLIGGIIAAGLTVVVLRSLYAGISAPLPFIPLPPQEMLTQSICISVVALSILFGIAGSVFGLLTAKEK